MSEGGQRKVVVAVDPAKEPMAPLRLGQRLARLLGTPVVLVTVFPHHPLLEGPEDELQRAARAEARRDLLEIGRSLEGVELADALAITGTSPARSLQHVSEGADAAVIVVGSTSRGPLRRIVPGSVAERLVSGAACAVAVAPRGYGDDEADDPNVVGVAFDGSDESQRALEAASELARRAGASLRVVTVNQRLAFGAVPVSADSPGDSVNRLLVAGSRGYGPVGAVLLGGTTHSLLRSAECPLLITPRGRGLELGRAA